MRALRIFLILGSLLAILFVAADRISVNMAESEAADRIQARQGIAGNASVSIRGFPFLTQLLAKRLDTIDLHLNGVQADAAENGQVVISEMSATLTDVTLGSGFSSATAGAAEGSALIGYDQFNEKSGERLKLEYAANNRIKVTAAVPVNGEKVEATAIAEIKVDSGMIRLALVDAEKHALEMEKALSFGYPVTGLPAGLKLKDAKPTADGISIELAGRDVRLAG